MPWCSYAASPAPARRRRSTSVPWWNVALTVDTVVSSVPACTGDVGRRVAQVHGRARRSGIGWLHHRPLNFHADGRRDDPSSPAGRGHSSSIAATIAAASSSLGAGLTSATAGLGIGRHARGQSGRPNVRRSTRRSARDRRFVLSWNVMQSTRPSRSLDPASGGAPPRQRPVLVRERAQVQALPPQQRGAGAAGRSSRPMRPVPVHIATAAVRRHRRGRRPRTSRASSRRRRSSGCESPASSPPRSSASPARRCGPGVTTEEIDAYVHELYIERDCYPSPLNYNGYPKSVCTSVNEVICHGIPDSRPLAGRRHRQPRRHRLSRRRARRHQRHVLRRRRRPAEPAARAGHRGGDVARHRGGQAGPAAERHRQGDRDARQEVPLRRHPGVRRPRHRRAVPRRHPGAALLRHAQLADHAAGDDVHDRADDQPRVVAASGCGTTTGRRSPPTASARPSSSTRSSSPTTASTCSPAATGAVSPTAPWNR